MIVRLVRGAELALLGLMGFLVVVDVGLAMNTGGLRWLAPLSGAVATVAVALRREWLERGTGVVVACSLAISLLAVGHTVNPSAACVMGLLVLTVPVTRLVPRPELALYLFGVGLAIMAEGLRAATQGPSVAFVLAWPLAGAVAFGGYLRWLDLQRSQAAVAARRDERLDLARELHDLVAHYVTGIVVQAQAGQLVAEQQPAAARDALARIERAGTDALDAMRQMVGSLRAAPSPAETERPAGTAGLEDLVRQHNVAGVPARLQLDDVDPDALAPAVAAAIHRIVLESLTNARRHAVDVTRIDVVVAGRGADVEVVVRDDGREAHLRSLRSPGFGLAGMTERAEALGGALTAGPLPDGSGPGWQVVASLPLDPQDRTR